MWNKPKQNSTYLIDFNLNKKATNLKKQSLNSTYSFDCLLLAQKRKAKAQGKRKAKGNFSNKLYKPIQSNSVLNKFRIEFSKTAFFPYKKPFMQFWVFPFFGACYLSFFTFTQQYTFTNNTSKNGYPFIFETSKPTKKKDLKFLEIKNSLQEALEPKFLLKFSKPLLNEPSFFVASYSNQKLQDFEKYQNQKNLELFELERLCSLYFKLTNNLNLTTLSSISSSTCAFAQAKERTNFLIENHLLQCLYLKKSLFHSNWYPLQMGVTVDKHKLAKKLNLNLFSEESKVLSFDSFNYSSKNLFANPIVQYFKTSISLDEIVKDSLTKKARLPQDSFVDNLKKFIKLEKFNFSEKKNALFYFSELLTELNKNKEEASKNYDKLSFAWAKAQGASKRQEKEPKAQVNNKLKLEPSLAYQRRQFDQENDLKKNLQNYYKLYFFKIGLNNYLRKVPLIQSNKQFIDMNSSRYLSEKHLNQLNLKNCLRVILLYQMKKQNFLLNPNKTFFVKKFQLLNQVKIQFFNNYLNNSLHSKDSVMLKKLFTEILMIQNWNQMFQLNNLQTFNSIFEIENRHDFDNLKFSIEEIEKKNKSLFQKIKREKKKFETQENNFNLLFFKQCQLYNKLNKISKSIVFETPLRLKNKSLQNEILTFQNPLLFANLESDISTKTLLNSSDFTLKGDRAMAFEEKYISPLKNFISNSDQVSNKTCKQVGLKSLKTLNYKFKQNELKLENNNVLIQNSEKNMELIKQFFKNAGLTFLKDKTMKENFPNYPNSLTFSNLKRFDLLTMSPNSLEFKTSSLNPNLLKKTSILQLKKSSFSLDKRKAEKIFRIYSSVKMSSNSNLKLLARTPKVFNQATSPKSIFPLLKKLKKNIQKELLLKSSFKNSFYFKDSFFKKTLTSYKTLTNSAISSKGSENSILKKQSLSNKMFLKQLGIINFFKKSNFDFINTNEQNYLEKTHLNQKKRRLKKLKLENRRRKKRKRFYPRPMYLRSILYFSFLKNRHSPESLNKSSVSSFYLNEVKQKFLQQTNFRPLQLTDLKDKIYRQNRQKWGVLSNKLMFFEKSSLQKFLPILLKPNYHQKEFYKISNQTLTEFEKLCWKSYWLRSNLTPYVSKMQKNLEQMKEIETFKTAQNLITPYLPERFLCFCTSKSQSHKETNKDDLIPVKSLIPLYLNMNYTLQNLIGNQMFHNFNELSNKIEYDSLLSDRITDEIKNVKSQLNIDGNLQPRSYKPGRQKVERMDRNPFFNVFRQFEFNPLHIEVQGSLNKDFSSIAALRTGGTECRMPTLRVLWAFHKTNLFQIKENNFAKNLWENYKNREKMKSNKTRKFLSTLFQINLGNRKKLQSQSARKTQLMEKKLQIFGQFVYKKNYHQYLRYLKFQVSKKPMNQFLTSSALNITTKTLNKAFLNEFQKTDFQNNHQDFFNRKNWFNPLLINKSQKPILNFWWSTSQKNSLATMQPNVFLDASVKFPQLDSYIVQNKDPFISNVQNLNFFGLNENFNKPLILTSFWLSCCLFHLAVFFALIRIPEIRSLMKFQFLIFLKLTNIYMIGLSSFYNLFKNYKNKLTFLLKNFVKVSNSSKFETYFFDLNLNGNTFQKKKFENTYKKLQNKNILLNQSFSTERVPNSVFSKYSSIYYYDKTLKQSKNLTTVFFQSTVRFNFLVRDFLKNSKQDFSPLFLNKNFTNLKGQALYPLFIKSQNRYTKIEVLKSNIYSPITRILWNNISNSLFRQKNLFVEKKRYYLAHKPQNLSKTNKPILFTSIFSVLTESMSQSKFFFSLSALYFMKLGLSSFYLCIDLFYKILFKLIDGIETIILIFYKFLEKPAEVMVNWIAELFLIEWTSDLTSYIPEIFDQQLWNSVFKVSRASRILSPFLASFIIQHFFLNTFQIFYFWLYKQDMDLVVRQKKGIIFWDIWTEILIQAAEKYKMNLSSLSTVKEEQQLLIENLLNDTSSLTKKNPFFASSLSRTRQVQRDPKNFSEQSSLHDHKELLSESNLNLISFRSFLNNSPLVLKTNTKWIMNNPVKKQTYNLMNPFLKFDNSSLKAENISNLMLFENQNVMNLQKRWAASQYLTTQGRDTDLFMDIHPPKSFFQLNFLKNYVFSHELLASLSCEIYSGLFRHKISKNLLIIGPSGTSKSFFIQALAGETELKIVTDNARRYSLVQGGVPVGMKLLRDVFDSIVLHSPCLFLLEDIHIIGERRPNLISDDEVLKSKDLTFGSEQDEVHEKNRMIYQVSRHSISHYKRPYKGDFSFSIPTNHFCYDLFLGIQPPRKRHSDLTAKSPLPLVQIQKNLENLETSKAQFKTEKDKTLISLLQTSLEQFFAPPSTSPFNILLLKEQKKLKPYKIVQQMPWSGLSCDQFIQISKSSYSVRIKVALLAEIAINNLAVKLDMITDLLVIVDSVRSNHGFVVFATTHLPSLLDPALRRPGRFDETISLPNFQSLLSRFEIFKVNLLSYSDTIDFLDYSFSNSEIYKTNAEIEQSISKSLSLLFNTKQKKTIHSVQTGKYIFTKFFNDYPIYSISQAFHTSLKLPLFNINKNKYDNLYLPQIHLKTTLSDFLNENQCYSAFCSKTLINYVSLNYGQAGQFLMDSLKNQNSLSYLSNSSTVQLTKIDEINEEFNFKSLYYSQSQSRQVLLKLFSGKFSEFFALTSFSENEISLLLVNNKELSKVKKNSSLPGILNNLTKSTLKVSTETSKNKQHWFTNLRSLQKTKAQNHNFENIENFQNYWQSALVFLDSFFQKRYLYNKNAIVSKMLFFENFNQLREPSSPPHSSILKPARQFENYKRTLKDFTEKPLFTINEKIKAHQNQRFLKVLYNVSVQKSFPNLSKQTSYGNADPKLQNFDFSYSFKELSYLDFLTLKPSSSYSFYKKNILTRQRFQFLNQWWNAQLPEHTVETTYISHIDWRSLFIESLGDFVIDFPDAEQYYNPKNRRWFLNSKSWRYWLDFEQSNKSDISKHVILQSLIKTYNILNTNRELFDYLAFSFLRNSKVKEIDFVDILIRFYKTSEC